ncbi:MAG: hypothetical protein R3Y24_08695 [Eubacteriales bacterium]
MIEKTENNDMRFVHCPVCGKCLMKASGTVEIETKCDRCGSNIIAVIEGEIVSVAREQGNKSLKYQGVVSIRITKDSGKKVKQMQI